MDYTKKKPLARAAQSIVNSCGADKANNNTAQPVALSELQTAKLLSRVSPKAKQAQRLVRHVANKPEASTSSCNVAALAVNLSDIALKYNPQLRKGGYELRCRQPNQPIPNRLGEPSGQVLWGLYPVENGLYR